MSTLNTSADFDINQKVVTALKTVVDPELNVNIVDLGLVYTLKIDEVQKCIGVEMTLSSAYCPMSESILSTTKNCVERNFSDFTVLIDLVWEPQWNYHFISAEGRKALGR